MAIINQAVASDVTRAAVYVRMSTSAQALSPKLQEAFLCAYARAHSMEVVRLYNDDGKSAKPPERCGLWLSTSLEAFFGLGPDGAEP